ncbi:hypothetical protein AAGR22_05340 [Erwinia sp. HDF1-3R]|uniref:DUF3472 domain-containing protein n=1 Tax=Erwinia sp. HDF1-3R TaxID=3141543 RepID=UPI0031F4A142
MKFKFKFKFLSLALTLSAGIVHADPTIFYEAPSGHGYDSMSAAVQIDSMTKQKGYFWANTYIFYEGNHQGYIGIQPRAEGESNLAIFSVFGYGAKSTSPNCNSGADAGKGVSCRVAYEFEEGRKYWLKIEKEEGGDSGYNKWLGTITDRDTGERVTIGEYMTPKSWGMLWRKSTFFDEWFPFNGGPSDASKRNCVPYAKLTTYNPVFSVNGKLVNTDVTRSRITAGQDKCAVAHGSPNARLTPGADSHLVENGIFTEK